jgi:hypothetical protein
VVDYFVPIGKTINALTAFQIAFADKHFFRQDKYKYRATGTYKAGQAAYYQSSRPGIIKTAGTYNITKSGYSRYRTTVSSVLTSGTLEVNLPHSLKKIANMASLLHQQLLQLRK